MSPQPVEVVYGTTAGQLVTVLGAVALLGLVAVIVCAVCVYRRDRPKRVRWYAAGRRVVMFRTWRTQSQHARHR